MKIEELKTILKKIINEIKSLPKETGAAVLLLAVLGAYIVIAFQSGRTAYVAGTSSEVPVYSISEETSWTAVKAYSVTRGSSIKRLSEKIRAGGVTYVKIKDSGAALKMASETLNDGNRQTAPSSALYMREDELSASTDDLVHETSVFVRTPVTIYANEEGPAIASFAPKGTQLKVEGYDRMNSDGSVNKYKIEYADEDGEPVQGYVYGKYMTDTQEKADAVYNENEIYDKAKKDVYKALNLRGGKAKNLDYYPYEKPDIENNEFCADARALYLNCAAVVHPKKYIKIINDTDCNAVVCDIKDGVLAYESDVAKELSPRSYKTAYVSKEKYKAGVDALKQTGVYTIGRIVVFNDPIYAKDHPKDCIKWGGNTGWPSPYSRNVWEYNVRLALEAIREFGFNEIQFDYVRFPENSYTMSKSGKVKWRNKYGEEKGQAVQNFIFYAADQIHEAGAYISVDVFGESAYGYMTAYGQYWPGISNIVDAISAMPYTDHTGGDGAWKDPYGTVKKWAKRAKKMQDYLDDPAAARTWITGYNTPYWDPTENYGKKQLKQQVNALKKAGLDGGFIPWNAGSSLSKYRQYKGVWNKDD